MDARHGTVYKIVSILSNEVIYIGSTINISARKATHQSACTNVHSRQYSNALYTHIRENGSFAAFRFDIIWQGECTRRTLRGLEQATIDLYDRSTLLNGINAVIDKEKSTQLGRDRALQYYYDNYKKVNRHITCCCGATITYNGKAMHHRTQKHKMFEPIMLEPLFAQ
jgi:hypothetical protein